MGESRANIKQSFLDFTNWEKGYKQYGGTTTNLSMIHNNKSYLIKVHKRETKRNEEYGIESSYRNNVFSEYIACKVIKEIGYPIQNVYLGKITTDKTREAVACEDFLKRGEQLIEFNDIATGEMIQGYNSRYNTDIEKTFEKINKISNKRFNKKELIQHFWRQFVVDVFIGNYDRHNDNWGVIVDSDNNIKIAPIYDCGSSMFGLLTDNMLVKILKNNELEEVCKEEGISRIKYKGKNINYYSFINKCKDKDFLQAVNYIVPKINIERICNMILNENELISKARKLFYCKALEYKYKNWLLPLLENKKKETSLQKKKAKVMSMYKYFINEDKIVAINREGHEKIWDEHKRMLDDWIEKKWCRQDGNTKYIANEFDAYSIIIWAYNIENEEKAKRLCKEYIEWHKEERKKYSK